MPHSSVIIEFKPYNWRNALLKCIILHLLSFMASEATRRNNATIKFYSSNQFVQLNSIFRTAKRKQEHSVILELSFMKPPKEPVKVKG